MVRLWLADVARTWQRFRNDSSYHELVLTSGRSLVVRLLGVSTGFLVTLITARFFSADALGVVSICIGILSLSSVFAKLGHDVALMRYIATFFEEKKFEDIRGIYQTSLRLVLPVTGMISLLLYIAAPWMSETWFDKPQLRLVLQWNSLLVIPLTLLQINSECLRGVKRIIDYTFFQTAAVSTFAVIGLLVAMVFFPSVDAPIQIQFVGIALAALISSYRWRMVVRGKQESDLSAVTFRQLNKTAGPMFTTTIMQLVMSWAGTLILASYRPASDVGVYNALIRISVFTNITILAINGLVMTRFVTAYHSGNLAVLKRHSHEATRLIFFTSLPRFALLLLFPTIVLTLFGNEFIGHENELYILLAGQFMVICAGLPGQLLNMTDRQHALRNIAIISATINLVSCFWLVPVMGMAGACWAQFAGTMVWTFLCVFSVYRRMKIMTFIGFSRW